MKCSFFLFALSLARLESISGFSVNNNVKVSKPVRRGNSISPLKAVLRTEETFLDGAEWNTIQQWNSINDERNAVKSNSVGKMTIVIGKPTENNTNDLVIGIKKEDGDNDRTTIALDSNCEIYEDSMAVIPQNKQNDDSWNEVIMTYAASLSAIHCAIEEPTITNIGGSDDVKFNPALSIKERKIVVIGGSKHACFVASGISAIMNRNSSNNSSSNNNKVYLISNGNKMMLDFSIKQKENIQVLGPSIAKKDEEIGFAQYIGDFDCVVDTTYDEGTNVEFSNSNENWRASGVVTLLKTRHNCNRYISTMTRSQKIIQEEGILFGPNEINSHLDSIKRGGFVQNIIPPPKFGSSTVQVVFDNDIWYSWDNKPENPFLRTWTVPDFWELASWPRDSNGSNIRYGFPIVEDLNTVSDELDDYDDDDEDFAELVSVNEGKSGEKSKNPFIKQIVGINGLYHDIIDKEETAVVFLSASYCRTCKKLLPGYTRFARQYTEDNEDNDKKRLIFAQADTSGPIGKELGRKLEINAVPMFILYQNGERYGVPIGGVTKFPSAEFTAALKELVQVSSSST